MKNLTITLCHNACFYDQIKKHLKELDATIYSVLVVSLTGNDWTKEILDLLTPKGFKLQIYTIDGVTRRWIFYRV